MHQVTITLTFDLLTPKSIGIIYWFRQTKTLIIVSLSLKMLGLYLYTLKLGHNSCNMLSILNKLTLQKEMQNSVTNNLFLDKK